MEPVELALVNLTVEERELEGQEPVVPGWGLVVAH